MQKTTAMAIKKVMKKPAHECTTGKDRDDVQLSRLKQSLITDCKAVVCSRSQFADARNAIAYKPYVEKAQSTLVCRAGTMSIQTPVVARTAGSTRRGIFPEVLQWRREGAEVGLIRSRLRELAYSASSISRYMKRLRSQEMSADVPVAVIIIPDDPPEFGPSTLHPASTT